MKIAIIGAGPIGLYTATKLAKRGFEVEVYEEHKAVGEPIQCTGLVTKNILNYITIPKEVLANKINTIKLNKTRFPIEEFVIYRNKFDKCLEEEAIKQGVKIFNNSSFQEYHPEKDRLIIKQDKKLKYVIANILIGADGPLSKVSKQFFNYKPENYLTIQYIIKNKKNLKDYNVYFNEEFKDFFIWQVPRNKMLMLGTATRRKINLNQKFKEHLIKQKIITSNEDILKVETGLIPIFNFKRKIYMDLSKENKILQHIFLVGDAAGQVKASTGGGIISGFKFADLLIEAITKNQYQKYKFTLKNSLNLILHKKIRITLNKFKESDYKELLVTLNKPKMKKILSQTSRDEPLKLLIRLFLADPVFILNKIRLSI